MKDLIVKIQRVRHALEGNKLILQDKLEEVDANDADLQIEVKIEIRDITRLIDTLLEVEKGLEERMAKAAMEVFKAKNDKT